MSGGTAEVKKKPAWSPGTNKSMTIALITTNIPAIRGFLKTRMSASIGINNEADTKNGTIAHVRKSGVRVS